MRVRGRLGCLLATLTAVGCSRVPLDHFIFFPDAFVPDPPAGVEERWITTEDGVRLHAWYAPPPQAARAAPGPPQAAPVLVWSHGNGGNIAGRDEVLLELRARGLGVLAYDYRGYGRSGGQPNEAGVYRDAQAAYDSERARGTPAARIICFGESLGGAVSIHLASERPCAGVAVVSTFTTLGDVARKHYGPLAILAGTRFDSLSRVGKLPVPVFVAHGDGDDIVPFALGERLFAAAHEPKRFFRAAGAHHNDVFESPGLLDAIADFARAATAAASDRAPGG
jgi:fermentation-respiration switch protein FrsA (DUF1100 family)